MLLTDEISDLLSESQLHQDSGSAKLTQTHKRARETQYKKRQNEYTI